MDLGSDELCLWMHSRYAHCLCIVRTEIRCLACTVLSLHYALCVCGCSLSHDPYTRRTSHTVTSRRRYNLQCAHMSQFVCLFLGCPTSQQQASVSQGRICSDNFTCCHTEIEVADPTFYLTQSQYTDTGPTSPSADPITPGAWQGSHWSANFEVTCMTRPRKNPGASGIRTQDLPLSRRTPYH